MSCSGLRPPWRMEVPERDFRVRSCLRQDDGWRQDDVGTRSCLRQDDNRRQDDGGTRSCLRQDDAAQRDELFPQEGPVRILLACNVDHGSGTVHYVTVQPDWSVDVDFDIATERIAAALIGETARCIELIEKGLPALRNWLAFWQRKRHVRLLPKLEQPDWVAWTIADEFPACGNCYLTWPFIAYAMQHMREMSHWESVFGLPARYLYTLWFALTNTGKHYSGVDYAANSKPADDVIALLKPPPPPADFTRLGFNRFQATELWACGVTPEWVEYIMGQLPFAEQPAAYALVSIFVQQIPLDWMREVAANSDPTEWPDLVINGFYDYHQRVRESATQDDADEVVADAA